MRYNYAITPRAVGRITEFYCNVALKYSHAYSIEDMERNIRQAIFGAYLIERGLARRVPTLARWRDYHMAHANKWYYAYTVEGSDIIVGKRGQAPFALSMPPLGCMIIFFSKPLAVWIKVRNFAA